MKWTKEKHPTTMIENAIDGNGDHYQIRAMKGKRLWQVYKNGVLFNDGWYTRHNAKAQVDSSLTVQEDRRRFNGSIAPINRTPRRTNKQIEMSKAAHCYKCNSTDRAGAVVSFNCTDLENREFSLCNHCLSLLIPFFTAYQPPVLANWNETPMIQQQAPAVLAAITALQQGKGAS